MGNSQSQNQHTDGVPEFEVTEEAGTGWLYGQHKGTGEVIVAATPAELERRAMAKRIAITWREGKKR